MCKESFEEREVVASATECTGLLPAMPLDDPNADADTARLYAIHAPKRKCSERCKENGKRRRS